MKPKFYRGYSFKVMHTVHALIDFRRTIHIGGTGFWYGIVLSMALTFHLGFRDDVFMSSIVRKDRSYNTQYQYCTSIQYFQNRNRKGYSIVLISNPRIFEGLFRYDFKDTAAQCSRAHAGRPSSLLGWWWSSI